MQTAAGVDETPAEASRLERELRRLWTAAWPIALLIAVFVVLDVVVVALTDLGLDGYREPILLWELSRRTAHLLPIAFMIAAGVGARAESWGPQWPAFDRGWSFRLPVGTAIVAATWWFSAYPYNIYLDRWHGVDRAALVLLAGLALWRPVFTVPWVLVATTLLQQFHHPIGGWSVAEPLQVIRVVELFAAALALRFVLRRWLKSELLLALACLLASAYFVSGVGKLRLGWLEAGGHVDANLAATYANGWLGSLSADDLSRIGSEVHRFATLLIVATVIVEVGAIAILWGRRALVGLLCLFIAFHLGVLALTGIFFWRWILVELALIAFLVRDHLIDFLPIFTWRHAAIASVLVLAGPVWARPADLSWLDAPVNYVYRFEATDAAGTTGQLPPAFFRPYDYQLTLSDFGYVVADPQLPITWGAIRDREIHDALHDAETAEQILAIEAMSGSVELDESRARELDDFVATVVANWNDGRRPFGRTVDTVLAPPQLITFGHDAYDGDGPIVSVSVMQITSWWDSETYREIRAVEVRRIDIPAGDES